MASWGRGGETSDEEQLQEMAGESPQELLNEDAAARVVSERWHERWRRLLRLGRKEKTPTS